MDATNNTAFAREQRKKFMQQFATESRKDVLKV